MELNDIKKELYREKPKAKFHYIRNEKAGRIAYYSAELKEKTVYFKIPIDDMGNADFFSVMEAKHLIRWIVI